jgi:hypothetical protein
MLLYNDGYKLIIYQTSLLPVPLERERDRERKKERDSERERERTQNLECKLHESKDYDSSLLDLMPKATPRINQANDKC